MEQVLESMTDEELKAPDCPSGCMKRQADSRKNGGSLHIVCECEWSNFNPYHSLSYVLGDLKPLKDEG